ncbi:MAG: tRNA pseudouridine(38-40) synthase TruA [Pirellulaceae bacterium]|nr:tRNA pseudouridine(38-40) synthase TruA [Pirellulaceae bacterium]
MSRTFKLTVAYDGTDYAGWQVQPNQVTIQGELQKALRQITKQSVNVVGSGRTDSGVHALAQVASCQIGQWNATATDLGRAINTRLPETIVVTEAVDAPDDFHAIRDAIGKRYRYQIQIGGRRDVFQYRYHWRIKYPLDIESMFDAAQRFVGEHDFASFQATGAERKTTVRDLRACDLIVRDIDGFGQLAIEVEANGFLYNMVRNIAGTLVEIGRGKHPPQWIDEVIAATNRDVAGPTAPPQGLFLQWVDYATCRDPA